MNQRIHRKTLRYPIEQLRRLTLLQTLKSKFLHPVVKPYTFFQYSLAGFTIALYYSERQLNHFMSNYIKNSIKNNGKCC